MPKGAERCTQRTSCLEPASARRNSQTLAEPPTPFATSTPHARQQRSQYELSLTFVMRHPGFLDESGTNAGTFQPVILFDRRPHVFVEARAIKDPSVSGHSAGYRNTSALYAAYRYENFR